MSAENVKVLESAYAAFARGDVPAVLAAFHEDITWTVPETVPFGGTYRGHEGVGTFFGTLSEQFSDVSVEPQEFIDGGDTIVVVARDRATGPGGSNDDLAIHLWRMRDGRAASFTEFQDTARTLQILGVGAGAASA
jgi:ketosteroid isomerase-like protein